jgi:hypothetical protein
MPDSPLESTRQEGDVKSLFGVDPRVELDISQEQVQAEAAGVAADEPEELDDGRGSPVPGQIAQTVAPEDPEPEAEEEVQQSALDRVMTHINTAKGKPAPQQGSGVEVELAEMRGRIDQQTKDTEAALRGISQPEVEAPRAPQEVNYDDPEIQELLAEAAGDPRKMGHAIKTIARLEGKALYGAKFKDLEETVVARAALDKEDKAQTIAADEMTNGLQQSYALGGLEAEIIEQAYKYGAKSLLFEHLQQNPTAALTAKGIVSSVLAIARTVTRADEALQQEGDVQAEPVSEEPGVVVHQTAPRGKSHNKRGQKSLKPQAPSAAADLKASIMGSQSHAKTNLPFLTRR